MPQNHAVAPHPALDEIAERGVYSLPWMGRDGEMVLVAVDQLGRRVAEASVYAGGDPDALSALLWQILDQADPPSPPLRLVS